MKNWLNLVTATWRRILSLTTMQQVTLIGSIILPAGILILTFSQSGQRIIRRLTKVRISKTFGNLMSEEEMWNDLKLRNERK
jgi:hypothetical protein